MNVQRISNEMIVRTAAKGNQEKWYDMHTDSWYKLDQLGYEALAEVVISQLLEESNIESDTPFTFVRYNMGAFCVRGLERIGCVSKNFLKQGQSIITLNRLLTQYLGYPVREKLSRLSSNKKRIAYLAEATAGHTGLEQFPEYLTLLFEIDALFSNNDRHLNNIAVLEQNGKFDYCPIFDNGAGLLSNIHSYPMDIEPKALISALRARPFSTTFTRQRNTARSLYGSYLTVPQCSSALLRSRLEPLLEYYPKQDRYWIADRVITCILKRQKRI